jgi:hypothetical protein
MEVKPRVLFGWYLVQNTVGFPDILTDFSDFSQYLTGTFWDTQRHVKTTAVKFNTHLSLMTAKFN